MTPPRRWRQKPLFGLVAAALAIGGCGGARKLVPTKPAVLMLYLPCVVGGPMRKVAAAYEARHPQVQLALQTYKPSERPATKGEPGVIITSGDIEMNALLNAQMIDRKTVRTYATNTYALTVVVPAGSSKVRRMADLTTPSVRRIFLDDPTKSTLGARAVEGFQKLGLWEKLRPKIISPQPGAMVLAELLAGKADAAVVFKDCLFGEAGEGGQLPKTLRMAGELPPNLYSPIPYQAAVVKHKSSDRAAQQFVQFLLEEEGREALRKAGLKPTS